MSKKLHPLQAEYNREVGYLKSTLTLGTRAGWHYAPVELPVIEGIPTEADIEYVRGLRKEIYKDPFTVKITRENSAITKKEIKRRQRKGEKIDFIVPSTPTPQGATPPEYEPQGNDTNGSIFSDIDDDFSDFDFEQMLKDHAVLKESEQILDNLYDRIRGLDPRFTGAGLWRPNKGGYHAQDTFRSHQDILLNLINNAINQRFGGYEFAYAYYIKAIIKDLDEAFDGFNGARYDSEIINASDRLANLLNAGVVSEQINMTLSSEVPMTEVDYEDEDDY